MIIIKSVQCHWKCFGNDNAWTVLQRVTNKQRWKRVIPIKCGWWTLPQSQQPRSEHDWSLWRCQNRVSGACIEGKYFNQSYQTFLLTVKNFFECHIFRMISNTCSCYPRFIEQLTKLRDSYQSTRRPQLVRWWCSLCRSSTSMTLQVPPTMHCMKSQSQKKASQSKRDYQTRCKTWQRE